MRPQPAPAVTTKAVTPTKPRTTAPPRVVTPTTPVKKADYCPNGDYTSSRYDGRCGTKPSTGGNTGGGFKPPTTSSSCTEGAIIKVPSQTSNVISTYKCVNGSLVKIG